MWVGTSRTIKNYFMVDMMLKLLQKVIANITSQINLVLVVNFWFSIQA